MRSNGAEIIGEITRGGERVPTPFLMNEQKK